MKRIFILGFNKHDISYSQLQYKLHLISKTRNFRYALYVFCSYLVLFSIAGMIEKPRCVDMEVTKGEKTLYACVDTDFLGYQTYSYKWEVKS